MRPPSMAHLLLLSPFHSSTAPPLSSLPLILSAFDPPSSQRSPSSHPGAHADCRSRSPWRRKSITDGGAGASLFQKATATHTASVRPQIGRGSGCARPGGDSAASMSAQGGAAAPPLSHIRYSFSPSPFGVPPSGPPRHVGHDQTRSGLLHGVRVAGATASRPLG